MENPSPDKTKPKPQEKRISPITLAVIVLTILFAAGLRIKQGLDLRRVVWADLEAHGRKLSVEVADTSAKRELGLGKRDSLAADHGMYFPFPAAQYWVFWMKGMRFPIDIVWIQGGKVVDISQEVQVDPGLPLSTYSPIEPADAVLELNAGAAREIGLQKGDTVTLTAKPSGS